ncbi:MAG: NAD(P)/FAD-dependent oxidoreductase [Fuerstiella sp.]
MQIAVAGCGIAGATAAMLLAQQGHRVTLFEQAPRCGPVGAGILLQPAGQRLLAGLQLLEPLSRVSARIHSLHAQHRTGRELVHLDYARLQAPEGPELFGLGVHRGELFQVLYDKCKAEGVQICEGCEVDRFEQSSGGVVLHGRSEPLDGPFDLLVAADGSRSRLRAQTGLAGRIREYDYAAVWLTGPCSWAGQQLLQIVGRDGRLVGVLPIGNGRVSFFWGIRNAEQEQFRSGDASRWKQQVVEFLPAAEEIVADVRSTDQLTVATYRNVQMRSCVHGRVVFIGDAAHASSPHLGQGANLALADGVCLAQRLAENPSDYAEGFRQYQTARRSTTRFYTQLTGLLTPFFQTDSRVRQFGRDTVLPIMPGLPYIGRQMLLTMAGLKTGWFTSTRSG